MENITLDVTICVLGINLCGKKFVRMLKAFNLEQHVSGPTHKNGNTLDLLITRSDVDFVSNVRIMSGVINPKLCNHHAVHSQVKLKKPPFVRKEITYRKLRSVNIESLPTDIKSSTPMSDFFGMEITTLVENFENTLTDLLATMRPLRTTQSFLGLTHPGIMIRLAKRRKRAGNWKGDGANQALA